MAMTLASTHRVSHPTTSVANVGYNTQLQESHILVNSWQNHDAQVKFRGRLGTMRGGKDKHDEISSPQVYTRSKDNWRRKDKHDLSYCVGILYMAHDHIVRARSATPRLSTPITP
uniref:Uncharacterized protein n=1 Tax=Aegilops tauschii TaxID=37682 RepID=M8BKV5_AEGTA